EFTGRIMADRTWSDGLHQLIEFKEGCKVTPRKRTAARITYQRFFRRYLRLAGMSGTAYEVKGELGAVYGLSVLAVPTHVPPRRAKLTTIVCATREEKWNRIVQEVETMRALGRPVLIGTRSVSASQELSACLGRAGVEHAVLNAEQSEDEAKVIAGAGRVGTVTVATNMAGRGVDIKVDPEALAMGGLHVVLS
ncbi:MAG: prepilin peptidase, partial [Mesorhizobium sp.]